MRLIWCILATSLVAVAGPPTRLSETGLYVDIGTKEIDPSHLSFSPQYPLWTDGAEKSRWISLPLGTKIENGTGSITSGTQDYWAFPVGTKVWKEFRFPRQTGTGMKRVETRYLEKTNQGWEFGSYLWDESESEAILATKDGVKNYYSLPGGSSHDIPSTSQCNRCHGRGGDKVLGFDQIQLSPDRDGMAPHGGMLSPNDITLRDLVERNLLTKPPKDLETDPPIIHGSTEFARAAMGYLHGNCGHCHNPNGSASGTQMFLRHSMSATSERSEPAYSTTVGKKTRFFDIPGQSETYRILPGSPMESAIYYRFYHQSMPPIGKKILDEEAATVLERWIREMP